MDLLCPTCNGLYNIDNQCDNCGTNMVNQGPIQNFFDDYSPYLNYGITEKVDGVDYDKCLHLYVCYNCGADKQMEVNKIRI